MVGFVELFMVIWLILLICDSDCCSIVDVVLYSFVGDDVFDVSDMIMIGELVGLILWYVGLFFSVVGRLVCVVLIVVCMLCVVLLMLWFRLNCRMICVLLIVFVDVILEMFVIELRCCLSGFVMLVVIVFGFVFGSDVCIEIVGKLICGSGDIGSLMNVNRFVSVMLSVSSVVVMGWVMKGCDRFIGYVFVCLFVLVFGLCCLN